VTALYAADRGAESLRVSAHPGHDRLTWWPAGAGRKAERDVLRAFSGRLLRSRQGPRPFVFRVTHSIRPEGAAAADARARAHAAATAARIRECCFDGRLRRRALRADGCGRRAGAAAFCLRHSNWRGWASLPSSPAAAGRNPLRGSSSSFRPCRCGPPLSARLPVRSCRSPPPFRRRLRWF